MNLSLPSAETAREVFEALRRDVGYSYRSEGSDCVLELLGHVGRGCVRSVGVRDGVELTVVDCVFRESFRLMLFMMRVEVYSHGTMSASPAEAWSQEQRSDD